MSEITLNGAFFDSTSTDERAYNQSDFSRVLSNVVSDGVCGTEDLKVTEDSGLTLTVNSGACFIRGFNRFFTSPGSIEVQPNTSGYIVAELSLEPGMNNIILKAVEGTALIQNINVWQMPLATYVANVTLVASLIDMRPLSVPANTIVSEGTFDFNTSDGSLGFSAKLLREASGMVTMIPLSRNEFSYRGAIPGEYKETILSPIPEEFRPTDYLSLSYPGQINFNSVRGYMFQRLTVHPAREEGALIISSYVSSDGEFLFNPPSFPIIWRI